MFEITSTMVPTDVGLPEVRRWYFADVRDARTLYHEALARVREAVRVAEAGGVSDEERAVTFRKYAGRGDSDGVLSSFRATHPMPGVAALYFELIKAD